MKRWSSCVGFPPLSWDLSCREKPPWRVVCAQLGGRMNPYLETQDAHTASPESRTEAHANLRAKLAHIRSASVPSGFAPNRWHQLADHAITLSKSGWGSALALSPMLAAKGRHFTTVKAIFPGYHPEIAQWLPIWPN